MTKTLVATPDPDDKSLFDFWEAQFTEDDDSDPAFVFASVVAEQEASHAAEVAALQLLLDEKNEIIDMQRMLIQILTEDSDATDSDA